MKGIYIHQVVCQGMSPEQKELYERDFSDMCHPGTEAAEQAARDYILELQAQGINAEYSKIRDINMVTPTYMSGSDRVMWMTIDRHEHIRERWEIRRADINEIAALKLNGAAARQKLWKLCLKFRKQKGPTPKKPTAGRMLAAAQNLMAFAHSPVPNNLPCGADDHAAEKRKSAAVDALSYFEAWGYLQEEERARGITSA